MKVLLSLAVLLTFVSCSSHKWKAKSSNPVALEKGKTVDQSLLKTEWGYIKISYDKTTDEGVFFDIELKNDSDKPVRYERGYVTLQSGQGQKYDDLQNTYIGKNAANSATSALNGNKLGMLMGAGKAFFQTAKVLGNGDIAPGKLHTDRLIYNKSAVSGSSMTISFGKELVKDLNKNTIQFVADSK